MVSLEWVSWWKSFELEMWNAFGKSYFKKSLCKIGANNLTSTITFKELNRKIEKFSKLLYRIVMGSIIFGFLLPPACLGLVNYYILDKKDESFDLPTPMMYEIEHFFNLI